jgi:mRNA-degrading endonuclease RelE of RelBE toxin-antitoxin system
LNEKPYKKWIVFLIIIMQDLRRLYIGHYVLTYKPDKKKEQITLVDFAHHDEVY